MTDAALLRSRGYAGQAGENGTTDDGCQAPDTSPFVKYFVRSECIHIPGLPVARMTPPPHLGARPWLDWILAGETIIVFYVVLPEMKGVALK